MNKPDYLHAENLATAVLAGHGTAARDLANNGRATDAELDDQAEGEGGGSCLWLPFIKSVSARSVQLQQWYAECVLWGHEALQNSVEIDPNRRGGVPVLKGTRFT